MRGTHKIGGDLQTTDESSKPSRYLREDTGSLFHLNYSSSFFATRESSGVAMADSSVVLKKAYGFCFKHLFAEPQIETTPDSLIITYPVYHKIHRAYVMEQLKWHITGFNPLNDSKYPICSHIQLKFTRQASRIYLDIKSCSFVDLYDYDVTELADILAEETNHQGKLIGAGLVSIHVNEKLINPKGMPTDVLVMQQTIDDGLQSMLESVYNYHVNCLKRFEEISHSRDIGAYTTAVKLGSVLRAVVKNYRTVNLDNYQLALTLLGTLEKNAAYQNDPQIWMSMPKIKEALTTLSAKAALCDGIEIEIGHLKSILKKLEYHEGV
uniref:hypothetical protein n=1 Tax=uncultured Legionella sp. TaxID=210934 RepID=UPI002619BAC8